MLIQEERGRCGLPRDRTRVTHGLTRRPEETLPDAASRLLCVYLARVANGNFTWVEERVFQVISVALFPAALERVLTVVAIWRR